MGEDAIKACKFCELSGNMNAADFWEAHRAFTDGLRGTASAIIAQDICDAELDAAVGESRHGAYWCTAGPKLSVALWKKVPDRGILDSVLNACVYWKDKEGNKFYPSAGRFKTWGSKAQWVPKSPELKGVIGAINGAEVGYMRSVMVQECWGNLFWWWLENYPAGADDALHSDQDKWDMWWQFYNAAYFYIEFYASIGRLRTVFSEQGVWSILSRMGGAKDLIDPSKGVGLKPGVLLGTCLNADPGVATDVIQFDKVVTPHQIGGHAGTLDIKRLERVLLW